MRGACWLDVGCGALLVACSATHGPRTGASTDDAPAAAPADHGAPADSYPVGFRSSWEFDPGRTYRTAFDEGATYGAEPAPRPVLMNVWYPARRSDAESMPHGGYLELPADDAGLARLAAALSAFERGVLAAELLRKDEDELTSDDHALLETTLRAPSNCVRGAPPADGPFPLAVYHAGAGSSFEDNAWLCEELARHGFVVVGSAFPKADGSSFGIDGRDGSARDMGFLVERASELPFVDGTRVALVGHSAGAQAILRHAGDPDCPADALVLLDTTLDYYTLGFPLQAELVAEITAKAANVDPPMLVVAGPGGQFQLCDRLVGSERTYMSVPDLDHNEHISQGHQKNELDLLRGRTPEGELVEAERIRAVRARYERECADVRLFLDAVLRDRPGEFEARMAELERNVPGGSEPWVERAARGTAGPPSYDPASDRAPTARQLGPLLASAGAARTCEILSRFREREPRSPIYDSTMAWGSLLFVLIDGGREDEARTLYGCLRPLMPRLLTLFTFAFDISRSRAPEDARRILRAGLLLEPDDEELLRRAAELER